MSAWLLIGAPIATCLRDVAFVSTLVVTLSNGTKITGRTSSHTAIMCAEICLDTPALVAYQMRTSSAKMLDLLVTHSIHLLTHPDTSRSQITSFVAHIVRLA